MKRPNAEARNGTGRRAVIAGLAGVASLAAGGSHARAAGESIRIGYVRWTERIPTISLLDKPAPDDGLAGGRLGIADNNTTGRFMGQSFALVDAPVSAQDDPVAALGRLDAQGIRLVLTDLPAAHLLKLADAAKPKDITLFNVGAPDDALRQKECRANVIHVAPSRAMLADALAQYLLWKKWTRIVLAYGSHKEDALLAQAYRRAAKRFGLRIVKELVYKDTGGARETDSGVVETQKQMPVFTQGLPDYEVLVTADENEVFAGYLPFRTWDARPVAGSAGLRPTSWSPNSVSWGGEQLQDRFQAMAHRLMTALDMQAWTAVRMVGEAASRTDSADPAKIMAYMKGPKFTIGAYKGQGLSLRDWDWQLRQPIMLADGRTVVSISPQPGFLHQFTELDTLGFDRPETTCKLP